MIDREELAAKARAYGVILKLEWCIVDPYDSRIVSCPICYRTKDQGHDQDCKLAEVVEDFINNAD